jgi:type II restriction/modification system DNA methylase subunit YeeA
MKLMFCMFAEDIELLPAKLFSKLLTGSKDNPETLTRRLGQLFEAMSKGGDFGVDSILYFNGGLFADADVVPLLPPEIAQLIRANQRDWSNVEPSIFGTLFERTLDPAKRSQIGAHYTSKDDILTLLKPVLMAPLQREWAEVQADCEKLWAELQQAVRGAKTKKGPAKLRQAFEKRLTDFGHRLADVKVLDPACGSGNFLYVAINLLLDLEKEVITYGANHGVSWFPQVSPRQLAGLEINPYAQQLAQVVIWIGYLQWLHHNGFKTPSDPVLEPIENIQLMDAILDLSDPKHPKEPEWPTAEFIVGNPPFLGDKKMRGELGHEYVEALRKFYAERLPGQSDVCCYWFEKARAEIECGKCRRAGLLATQGIRGGGNRRSLERIKETGDIFWALSDHDWVLEGAHVHVSMVGFDNGANSEPKELDGRPVLAINSNLTSGAQIVTAAVLSMNQGISFLGSCKGGSFDIDEDEALLLLSARGNPNHRPNSDVLRPLQNSKDILQSRITRWIIDNADLTLEQASLYEEPHRIVLERVKPARDSNRDAWLRTNWWRPQRMRPNMRQAVDPLPRFLVTTTTSKHRVFVWLYPPMLPDHQLIVFAKSDDYSFGLLHSRVHEVWARAQGTQLRERESGFRYTPTTCFETFPFPQPTPAQEAAIAQAAKDLDRLRINWLNPLEWTREEVLEFPGSVDGPWARFVHADAGGIGTVRYPRIVPKDPESAKLLARRTLTNVYNERPTWLDLAHRKLDEAVFAAYDWDPGMTDEDILAKLLEFNLQRRAV